MPRGVVDLAGDGRAELPPPVRFFDGHRRVEHEHVLYLEAIEQLVEPVHQQVLGRGSLDCDGLCDDRVHL
jgi:hypothetical protein